MSLHKVLKKVISVTKYSLLEKKKKNGLFLRAYLSGYRRREYIKLLFEEEEKACDHKKISFSSRRPNLTGRMLGKEKILIKMLVII